MSVLNGGPRLRRPPSPSLTPAALTPTRPEIWLNTPLEGILR